MFFHPADTLIPTLELASESPGSGGQQVRGCVEDPPGCGAGSMSNPRDTYQQCEAVLWQHPILLDKPLSGCTGELREHVPKLVDIDHLLRVCI